MFDLSPSRRISTSDNLFVNAFHRVQWFFGIRDGYEHVTSELVRNDLRKEGKLQSGCKRFIVWLFKWINFIVVTFLLLAAFFFFMQNFVGFEKMPLQLQERVAHRLKQWGFDVMLQKFAAELDMKVNHHRNASKAVQDICGTKFGSWLNGVGFFWRIRVYGLAVTATPQLCNMFVEVWEQMSTPSTGPKAMVDYVQQQFGGTGNSTSAVDEEKPQSATDTPPQDHSLDGSDSEHSTPPESDSCNVSHDPHETPEHVSPFIFDVSEDTMNSIGWAVTGALGYGMYWFFTQG